MPDDLPDDVKLVLDKKPPHPRGHPVKADMAATDMVEIICTVDLNPWAGGRKLRHNERASVMRWEADLICGNGHAVMVKEQ